MIQSQFTRRTLYLLCAASLGLAVAGCDSSGSSSSDSTTTGTGTNGLNAGRDSAAEEQLVNSATINVSLDFANDAAEPSLITARLRSETGDAGQVILDEFGNGAIVIPALSEARADVVDITGDTIVPQQIDIMIPAGMALLEASGTVIHRAAPIAFNTSEPATITTPDNITVTVPANAFEHIDGTVASGEAQALITSVDLLSENANIDFVPNLIGLAEGATEPTAIESYGMAEFTFFQDGQELQLADGMEAAITIPMATDIIRADDASILEAQPGSVIPLWYYDEEAAVWQQDGLSTVVSDPDSPSGFSASGTVSHFSWWNIDGVTPWVPVNINVQLVDTNGSPVAGVQADSYRVTAYMDRVGGHGETPWRNTVTLTPSRNTMTVLGNGQNRAYYISTISFITDYTYVNLNLSSITIDGAAYSVNYNQRGAYTQGLTNNVVFTVEMLNGAPTQTR